MTPYSVAVDEADQLGESPLWHPGEQALYWLDIKAPAIRRLDPATGARADWRLPQEIGSIGLHSEGRFVAGLRDGFAIVTLVPDSTVLIDWLAKPELDRPENRLNDGKCDRQGRFWSGSFEDPPGMPAGPRERTPLGTLYRLDPDHRCHAMEDGILVSNSLCWSPDGNVMYFADSPRREIRAYRYDPRSGAIVDPKTFARLAATEGTPDGSTVDAEGCLWNARFGGGKVVRYRPNGALDREIVLPVTRPTCCAFGGPELKTLYVTSGRVLASAEELAAEPLAGAVFAIECDVPGLPERPYAG